VICGTERDVMDKSTNKDVRENIISILDCLLKNEARKCASCKNCEDVDVCCFLTDAVVVANNYKKRKTDLAT
jgi:hypothetical protein